MINLVESHLIIHSRQLSFPITESYFSMNSIPWLRFLKQKSYARVTAF